MKTEQIVDILKRSGADAWELTVTSETGWEFYLIRHRLDQNRVKNIERCQVKVYKALEEGRMLGSASAELAPTATKEEAEKIIHDLLADAAYVRNPAYTLNTPTAKTKPEDAEVDVRAIAGDFLDVMRSLPETTTEDVNSYEIFVTEVRRRFLNSEGIDVSFVYPNSELEVVLNARDGEREIELYRLLDSGACDREGLKRDLTEALRYGRDKLSARPTPALGKMAVLFSTDAATQFYDWFIGRMSTGLIYQHISDWELGKPIAEEVRGDRVTLEAVRSLPNSSRNFAYDAEGAPIRDETLIEENVARHYWGSRQFSQYIGVQDSFRAENFRVTGGTQPSDALRQGKYLEVVEFSDFQVNPFNGDIAGEIRLGYLHDGDQVYSVSGGSVSGTMAEAVRDMRMSQELRQYDHLLIPAVTRLEGLTVTGKEA